MLDDKKRIYMLEIALTVFFIIAAIYSRFITRKMIAIVLFIVMIFCVNFAKNEKVKKINSSQVSVFLFAIGLIYVVLLYMLGISFGFYNSTIKFGIWSIKKYIIPYIVIIVSIEIFRKSILLKDNKKSSFILVTVATVLLDVILTTDIKNLASLEDFVTLLGFVLFASIASNLLYNYIVINFKTSMPNIIYRLITTLYPFILPITPDIYVFFESIIRMVIPFLIYLLLEKLYNKKLKTKIKPVGNKRKDIILTVITGIIVAMIVMLVSCRFTYGIMVVGSGSMTGTINKGDLIVYKQYDQKEIKTGEIILFDKEGTKTIHRVVSQKQTSFGNRYYTKGDANQSNDEGYRVKEDVLGRIKFRIPYIGYLNLWLSDLFK